MTKVAKTVHQTVSGKKDAIKISAAASCCLKIYILLNKAAPGKKSECKLLIQQK